MCARNTIHYAYVRACAQVWEFMCMYVRESVIQCKKDITSI